MSVWNTYASASSCATFRSTRHGIARFPFSRSWRGWLPAIGLLLGSAHAQQCPAPQPASNMKRTFDSAFTSGHINAAQWNRFPNEPVTYGSDDESYVPSEVSASTAAGLMLRTDAIATNGLPYRSAEVSTRGLFSQQYGHFEMSGRVPQADGLWPAFWLLPEDNSWPPEIDVLEYIYAPWGQVPTEQDNTSYAAMTLHWVDAQSQDQYATSNYTTPLGWGSAYHTYAVDWRPGSLVWEIDGNVVNCLIDTPTTGARVPAKPMFMILNDGVSKPNGWPGTVQSSQSFPLYFDIAYVRAYSFKDLPPTPPPATGAVRNVTVSPAVVKPGQTITVKANLVIGAVALGSSATTVTIKSWDGLTNYANITVSANLPANTTVPITVTYTVPANFAAGSYVITVWTAYNNWTADFYNPEAQIFKVVSAGKAAAH
jgi:beta-glucanase (GH16 family)